MYLIRNNGSEKVIVKTRSGLVILDPNQLVTTEDDDLAKDFLSLESVSVVKRITLQGEKPNINTIPDPGKTDEIDHGDLDNAKLNRVPYEKDYDNEDDDDEEKQK